MTKKYDIDKIFSKGLADFSEQPPAFVWDNIEEAILKKKKNKRRIIIYFAAASVVLLFSFGAGVFFNNSFNNKTVVAENNTPKVDTQKNQELKAENSNKQQRVKEYNNSEAVTNIENGNNTSEDKNTVNTTKTIKKEVVKPLKINEGNNLLASKEKIENSNNTKNKEQANINNDLEEPLEDNCNGSLENTEMLVSEQESNKLELESIEKQELKLPLLERDLKYEYREALIYPIDEVAENTTNSSSWSVGVNASPMVSYRNLQGEQKESPSNADNAYNYNNNYKNEKPLVAYSAGVEVNYSITKRLKVQSGLYISEMGQVSKNVAVNSSPSYYANAVDNSYYTVNTSMGNIRVKESPNQIVRELSNTQPSNRPMIAGMKGAYYGQRTPDLEANFVQTFDYCEIPLILNFNIIDRKTNLNMLGGVSTSVLYGNSTYIESEGEKYSLTGKSEDINPLIYSGIMGLSLNYPILPKFFVSLQPTFKYAFNSLSKQNQVHPYSFGVYTGLSYKF